MRSCSRVLDVAGALCAAAFIAPLVIPAVVIWAYCTGGGNIVGDR